MKNLHTFNASRLFAAILVANASLANAQVPISIGGAGGASAMVSSAAGVSAAGASLSSGLSTLSSAAMSGGLALPVGSAAGFAGVIDSTMGLTGHIEGLSGAEVIQRNKSHSDASISGSYEAISHTAATANGYTSIPQALPGLSDPVKFSGGAVAEGSANLRTGLKNRVGGLIANGLELSTAAELGANSVFSAGSTASAGENVSGLSVGLIGTTRSVVSAGTIVGGTGVKSGIDTGSRAQAEFSRADASSEKGSSDASSSEDNAANAEDRANTFASTLGADLDGRIVGVGGQPGSQSLSVGYEANSGAETSVDAVEIGLNSNANVNFDSQLTMGN